MGNGIWSTATNQAVSGVKIATGTNFAYDSYARRNASAEAHDSVNVTIPNKAGVKIRECRDSADHPNSKAKVIMFDETGSMGNVPRQMQKELKRVFGLTLDKGVKDVQIAVAAYGDALNYERAPIQVSQFESDNAIDDALDNLFLEGNGGGNGGETPNLVWYYLAHYAELDSLEKRGIKGHIYMVADEVPLELDSSTIEKYIGDSPRGGLSTEAIVDDLLKKFDVTILLVDNSSAKWQRSYERYSSLFGPDNVIVLEGTNAIPETIAGLIALDEGVDSKVVLDELSDSKELARVIGGVVANRNDKARKGLR